VRNEAGLELLKEKLKRHKWRKERSEMYRPREERELTDSRSRDTRGWIADVLHDDDRAVNEASIGLVYDWIDKNRRRDFTKASYVREAAQALNLASNDDLWREVFANNPDLDTGASRAAVKALSHSVRSPFDVSHLRKALQAVIENTPELLVLTPEATERQRRLEQRAREINQITNNYKSGFKIRTPNGGTKVYDKDGIEIQFSSAGGRGVKGGGFDEMTDDQIHSIYEQVTEQRRLQGLSKEQLRSEINPQRQKAFEASSVSLGSNPAGVELVHPDTGAIINSKRELIQAINSKADITKRMLTRNGITDRVLAKRFEFLLNS
jgi:hypothetical protein